MNIIKFLFGSTKKKSNNINFLESEIAKVDKNINTIQKKN